MQLQLLCLCVAVLGPNKTICHISLRCNIIILLTDLVEIATSLSLKCSGNFLHLLLLCLVWENTSYSWKRMKLDYDVIADYPWPRWLSQDIMADRIIRATVAWLYTFPDTCLSYYRISSTCYKKPNDAKIDHMDSGVPWINHMGSVLESAIHGLAASLKDGWVLLVRSNTTGKKDKRVFWSK